jgi:hypothetical protein
VSGLSAVSENRQVKAHGWNFRHPQAIPPEDFGGHDFSAGAVPYAWRMPDSTYEHVLVQCETPNVFLVLVLDLIGRSVAGHHLLDLNRLYGLA